MRKRQWKRFDHGEPIAKIDTRPLAFVMVFLVIVITIGRFPGLDLAPEVELPIAEGERTRGLEHQFVVTITTTSMQEGDSPWEGFFHGRQGECRAFVGDGEAVTSEELYNWAFNRLDALGSMGSGGVEFIQTWDDPEPMPAYVRADSQVPWQCVGGVIYAIERAGFNQIRFLTTPPPPDPSALPPPPIHPDRSAWLHPQGSQPRSATRHPRHLVEPPLVLSLS